MRSVFWRDVSRYKGAKSRQTCLLWVISQLPDDDGWKIDLLAVELLSADHALLGFDTEGGELLQEEVRHGDNVLGVAVKGDESMFNHRSCHSPQVTGNAIGMLHQRDIRKLIQ